MSLVCKKRTFFCFCFLTHLELLLVLVFSLNLFFTKKIYTFSNKNEHTEMKNEYMFIKQN